MASYSRLQLQCSRCWFCTDTTYGASSTRQPGHSKNYTSSFWIVVLSVVIWTNTFHYIQGVESDTFSPNYVFPISLVQCTCYNVQDNSCSPAFACDSFLLHREDKKKVQPLKHSICRLLRPVPWMLVLKRILAWQDVFYHLVSVFLLNILFFCNLDTQGK